MRLSEMFKSIFLLVAAAGAVLLGGCGSSGGSAAGSSAATAATYTSAAMAGELVSYSVDTANLTYSYTITSSQYGQTGQTGSGTLTKNADGSYNLSGISNAHLVVLPNGLLLGAVRESINGIATTVPIVGISNPVTTFAAAAATYNYVQRYCITGTCYSDYGTFQITSNGTWSSCSAGNLATGCAGTTVSGTLNSLGGGEFQVLSGGVAIGTAIIMSSGGQNVVILDLSNASNGLGLLFGSSQQAVTTTDTNGVWASATTTGLHEIFTAAGNLISYNYVNGVASTATTTITSNSPWNGLIASASGGVGILAGTGVYAYANAGGYAEIGVKIK